MCRGSGSCTMKPSIDASSFNWRTLSSSSASVTSDSYRISVDWNPHASHASTLFFTYVSLPPSCPTRMAARCGRFFPCATRSSTSCLISSLILAAVALPSINV